MYACLLIIAVLMIGGAIVLHSSEKNTTKSKVPTPTPHLTKTNPPVAYDKQSNMKMLDMIKHRTPLSPADTVVKNKIITKSGLVKETPTYKMEYIHAGDEFLVEIKTVNINQAKEDSVAWLKSKGLSDQGVCHLPLVYYLNHNAATSLRGLNIKFSPLPPGC